ncbi:hypothetical protein PRZ48_005650 [Zasmidium cellare]|uniref:DUF7587 domain-containing protein n=1 Tax=Zasmidium cellare TaxID=395010 RepID=A0ABR0ELU6_ZASCE|nr:hypothetical protein PRZ48_005650 [Zasmidium cellare]
MDAQSPLDVLQSLKCTRVPPILWRVQYSESRASFDENCNLVARLSDSVPTSLYELRASLARHLKWGYSRADSYFISTFSEYIEALQWAKARRRSIDESEEVTIYKIRTCHLAPHTMVFKVDKVMQKLGMEPLLRSTENEFVILNRIPSRAISLHEHIEPEILKPRVESRSTPWGRTLERRSQIYLFHQTNSTDALCAQYLARLDTEHRRKSAYESVYDWVPPLPDERYEAGGEREEFVGRVDSLVGVITGK